MAMGFPGRHAATILWVVASIGFTVYVANFNSYDKTYGSLGGVIILLTWLYLSALMVLFGAVINAQGLVSSGNPVPGRRGADGCPGSALATRTPVRSPPPLPARIGPVEFAEFGRMVAVRCPRELAHVMQRAGGVWEPGSRRWLIDRRVWPVIRALERETDPLFRQAGMSLD